MFVDAQVVCERDWEAEQRLYRLMAQGTIITGQDPPRSILGKIPDLVGRLWRMAMKG